MIIPRTFLSCTPLLLCLSLVFSQPLLGSENQQQPLTFRGQSNLVLVPTVVHDKSGAHVPNLKKEDFTLFVDGHARQIAVFEEVRPGNQLVRRVATQPGEFTNLLSGEMQPNRVTVIALDTVMTPELRQTTAREHLLRLLAKTIQTDSTVALVLITTTGTRVIHDFTTDPKVLVTALNNVVGSMSMARDTKSMADQEPSLWSFGTVGGDASGGSSAGKNEALELDQYYRGEFERKSQALERRIAISREMDALEQVAHALRGLPGRKSLIWVAGGFPFTVTGSPVGVGLPGNDAQPSGYISTNPQLPWNDPTSQLRTVLPTYERVWRAMNDADIAVYAIDTRGLTTEGDDPSVRLPNPNEQERQHALKMDTQDTFRIFADVTGGRAYTNTNDFENAYRESMDDSAAYYLLGYYVDRKKDKEGWHELNVKLSRAATEVRSRRGFILRTSEDKNTQQQEIDTAMRAPLDYTGIPIAGRVLPGPANGSKRKFKVSLLLPPGVASIDASSDNHLDLAFLVRIQAPDGTTVAHSAEQQEGHLPAEVAKNVAQQGVRYEREFELSPGEYWLHLVVRDNVSGRIGSVNSELKVPQAEAEAK